MVNIAKFDRQDVLEKATGLFWKKGFRATSTRDLQQAMNMRPGSMYAAFGGKSDIYRLVLEQYALSMSRLLEQSLEATDTIPDGIRHFIKRVLLHPDSSEVRDVCLLYRTVSELDDDQAELLELARTRLKNKEARFAVLIEEAKTLGQLPGSLDAKATAADLQCRMLGIRSYLRITCDLATIEIMIDGLLRFSGGDQ